MAEGSLHSEIFLLHLSGQFLRVINPYLPMAGTELATPPISSRDKASGDEVKMAMGGPGSQSEVNRELPGPGLILSSRIGKKP